MEPSHEHLLLVDYVFVKKKRGYFIEYVGQFYYPDQFLFLKITKPSLLVHFQQIQVISL